MSGKKKLTKMAKLDLDVDGMVTNISSRMVEAGSDRAFAIVTELSQKEIRNFADAIRETDWYRTDMIGHSPLKNAELVQEYLTYLGMEEV